MKKIFLLISISLLSFNILQAQTSNRFDPSRITFGGSLGLQFGDYTAVNIAPQVGYTFNQYVNAGAGISYTYYKDDWGYGSNKIENTRSYFGLNVYGRFYPTNFLVFLVQPEANRMWSTLKAKGTGYKETESKFVPSVVVGGGVTFGPVMAMIKYDIVQDHDSPYGKNIFYSIGYTF